MRTFKILLQFFYLLSLTTSPLAFATDFNHIKQIVIFGDSYSDNGNTYQISKNTYPGQAYYLGRFFNGPTWSEYFAGKLGFDATDATKFRNYAYGQAQINGKITLTTHQIHNPKHIWQFTVPDLTDEINQYLKEGDIKPKETLYFIFIGTNDLLNYSPSSATKNQQFIAKKFKELEKQINILEKLGANHLIVFNMRYLQSSPLAKQLAEQYKNDYLTVLTAMIKQYNNLLWAKYKNDKKVIIYDIYQFDFNTLNKTTNYNWYRQKFTLQEKAEPCYINKGNYIDQVNEICAEPWQHFYYDRIHSTTYINKLMSDDLFNFLLHNNGAL